MKIINRNKNEKLKIVITGATSGIGKKLAKGFAEDGYYVEAIGLGVIPEDRKNIRFTSKTHFLHQNHT